MHSDNAIFYTGQNGIKRMFSRQPNADRRVVLILQQTVSVAERVCIGHTPIYAPLVGSRVRRTGA